MYSVPIITAHTPLAQMYDQWRYIGHGKHATESFHPAPNYITSACINTTASIWIEKETTQWCIYNFCYV